MNGLIDVIVVRAGSPSQAGLIKDAEAAFDYLLLRRDVCDPDTIFLFGRSLGGAVAMELASRREGRVRGIIVEVRYCPMPRPHRRDRLVAEAGCDAL